MGEESGRRSPRASTRRERRARTVTPAVGSPRAPLEARTIIRRGSHGWDAVGEGARPARSVHCVPP